MTTGRIEPESSDRGIKTLLRAVGARHEPRAEVTDDVRAAVYVEWQRLINQRPRQRRIVNWGLAASLSLAVFATAIVTRAVDTPPAQVASITNINGELTSSASNSGVVDGAVGQSVRVGDELQTDHNSRAALTFPKGLSLRLDHGTRLSVAATDRVVLTTGAIYIDAPPGNDAANSLTVETSSGSVQHVGTQYEVRSNAQGTVVSV
ncbi:FecR domain-containing protein, partial [Steroidobacter sp.]|uniref:FecR domain-containing protein n=1 Tax=Steroidobacter sp. TaxID=1978227 RepID=UPI001A4F2E85